MFRNPLEQAAANLQKRPYQVLADLTENTLYWWDIYQGKRQSPQGVSGYDALEEPVKRQIERINNIVSATRQVA